jgi:hypothetical protein
MALASVALITGAAGLASQQVRSCTRADERVARAVRTYLRSTTDTAADIADLHLPCGKLRELIASAWLPGRDTPGDYGPRVVTLRPTGDGWALAEVTRGLGDSHLPPIRLFASADRVLVLAGLGDEGGSWGIATYEIIDGKLAGRGLLDVGLPTDEDDQSALDDVRVSLVAGHWQSSLRKTVVLRPNQDTRAVIRFRPPRTITFRLTDAGWNRQ